VSGVRTAEHVRNLIDLNRPVASHVMRNADSGCKMTLISQAVSHNQTHSL